MDLLKDHRHGERDTTRYESKGFLFIIWPDITYVLDVCVTANYIHAIVCTTLEQHIYRIISQSNLGYILHKILLSRHTTVPSYWTNREQETFYSIK